MTKKDRSKVNVLLVEDDDVCIFLSVKALRAAGIKNIAVAKDGEAAYSCVKKSCPDIILLDLNLPIMDGFEFLEEKEKGGYCLNSKIAVITSSTRQKDRERVINYNNIIDYIVKPIDDKIVDMLIEKI